MIKLAAADAPFLTVDQLAARYQVSAQTIRDWRLDGKGPVATKLGGSVRYALADVIAWEREQREAAG